MGNCGKLWGEAVFRGLHKHTVDEKGRLSIPSKFREALETVFEAPLFITVLDSCLVAYPADEWRVLEAKLLSGPDLDMRLRRFRRHFYSPAQECPVDKAGRILLPPSLREWAGLQRDVTIAGMGRNFEIWDAARHEAMLRDDSMDPLALFRDAEELKI